MSGTSAPRRSEPMRSGRAGDRLPPAPLPALEGCLEGCQTIRRRRGVGTSPLAPSPAIALVRHAALNASCRQGLLVLRAGVLAAPVRVVHQPARGLTALERQRIEPGRVSDES